MNKILTLSIAAAALVGSGGVAYAQADAGQPTTRADVERLSAEAFARMDANNDGVLNQADREARRQEMQQRRFARLDADSNGELNQADREARRREAFDRIDADRSGGISFEEFATLREQRMERREARSERGAAPRGMRGPGMRGSGGPGGPGMSRAADANSDGSITQAEFAAAALARFDRIDADKDGTISAEERPQPRRTMRMMRRPRDAG